MDKKAKSIQFQQLKKLIVRIPSKNLVTVPEFSYDLFATSRVKRAVRCIAKVYGLKVRIASPKNMEGYYAWEKKLIVLKGWNSTAHMITTFCHELSHHIQEILYFNEQEHSLDVFEQLLDIEQEADRLSYVIYRKYFVKKGQVPLDKKYFQNYKNIDVISQLKDFWDRLCIEQGMEGGNTHE